MSFTEICIYASIQGLSEFLPISSSAHLLLAEKILQIEHTLPAFMEVAVHLGSLCVLLVYFWRDVKRLFRGGIQTICLKRTEDARFFQTLLLATIPAVLMGLWIEKTSGRALFQTLEIIAWMTCLFGALLYFADRHKERYNINSITFKSAFFGWGLAQCLAFVHGVSRSGICITFGRFSGYQRNQAVRFAFLMALPTLSGAFLIKFLSFLKAPCAGQLGTLTLGVLISFLVGFATIHLLMKMIRTSFLKKIALYRFVLGLILLYGVYFCGWA